MPFTLIFADNSINALKRKISLANEETAAKKLQKEQEIAACAPPPQSNEAKDIFEDIIMLDDVPVELSPPCTPEPVADTIQIDLTSPVIKMEPASDDAVTAANSPAVIPAVEMLEPLNNSVQADSLAHDKDNVNSPSRRGSQESNATTTTTGTTTTATTGSESTSSSSSESSSSDSSSSDDSDSDSSEDDPKVCFSDPKGFPSRYLLFMLFRKLISRWARTNSKQSLRFA